MVDCILIRKLSAPLDGCSPACVINTPSAVADFLTLHSRHPLDVHTPARCRTRIRRTLLSVSRLLALVHTPCLGHDSDLQQRHHGVIQGRWRYTCSSSLRSLYCISGSQHQHFLSSQLGHVHAVCVFLHIQCIPSRSCAFHRVLRRRGESKCNAYRCLNPDVASECSVSRATT
jgi:hypothetical protein